MDTVNTILIAGVTGCAIVGAWALRSSSKNPKPSLTEEIGKRGGVAISLQELSALWARSKESGEILIQDIAPIWCESKNTPENKKIYQFQDDTIASFWHKFIDSAPYFQKSPKQKDVCFQILKKLETEGDCPSVVNASDDVESSWDSSTYELLGRTTLLQHTLNVAKQCVEILTAEGSLHVIPDTMVAALGHDLGKLPSIRDYTYSLGDHPLSAGKVLAEIEEYKTLSRKDEISRAIKLHHKKPEGLLGTILKKADQKARELELEWAVERFSKKEPPIQSAPAAPPASSTEINTPTEDEVWRARADLDRQQEETVKNQGKAAEEIPRRMDISKWFDAQEFLDHLKPYINRINGRRFMAFSMPNGYVFFQAKALEEVTRKMAEEAGAMDIVTMASDDPTMRQVLFTVVDHLRVEHEVIARELIKDRFFGGFFTVHTNGRKMKGFYTPFHSEPFGNLGKLEEKKTGILKNIKKVEPFTGE